MALAGVVCALDRDIATTNDRTENLPPLAPEELAKAIPHLADCIPNVRVLGWVKQINETDQAVNEGEVKPRQLSQAVDL
jgi:hypothetical protein